MTIPVVVQMTVDSGTTYDLSADTNLQEIDLDNELEINVVSYDVPEYEGSYTVDAGLSPVVLNTQDKRLTQNVTVNALTENSVSMTDFVVAANSGVAAITSTVTSGYSATAKSTTTTVQLPTQSGTTITPTTSEQTAVAKGKYTTGVVKVGAIPSEYADITGVTAQASDVLAGKYFVNNLGELTLGTGTGGGGLDTETKDALLECFEHVAWADSDGQIYYNNLLNALYPLQSISAVYTQSGDVYADTPLDDLKADLVVTATFEDGTVKTVTNYTLSGTLAVGTSTVTVTYFTETTTFNVTVSAPQPQGVVYQLPSPLTYDGTQSGSYNTEYTLLTADSNYSITCYITRTSTPSPTNSYIFQCMQGSSPYWGLKMQIDSGKYQTISYGVTDLNSFNSFSPSYAGILKIVVRHTAGATNAIWQMAGASNSIITKTIGNTLNTATSNTRLAGNGFIGTINSFTIYNRVLTDAEAETFLTTN